MNVDVVMKAMSQATLAIEHDLAALDDWTLSGLRDTQYNHDLVADAAALPILLGAGLGVVSEESGSHEIGRDIVVVIDPVDGSTNASVGLPWWCKSLCAVDSGGPLAAIVGHSSGKWFEAVRGDGATFDNSPCVPRTTNFLSNAVIATNRGLADQLGVYGYRIHGSIAMDLCAVAGGWIDAYVDLTVEGCNPWDYLGGWLMCTEAGVSISDALDRALDGVNPQARRNFVAACTSDLHSELLAARKRVFST